MDNELNESIIKILDADIYRTIEGEPYFILESEQDDLTNVKNMFNEEDIVILEEKEMEL